MNNHFRLLVVIGVAMLPTKGHCCEPIVPLYHLLSGASFAGPAVLLQSSLWLGIAIAIKCSAFVFFERRLPWPKAVAFMIIANVISTIPGVLIAALTSSMVGILIALPLIGMLGWELQDRLKLHPEIPQHSWIGGGGALLMFVGFFILSVVLFGLANTALQGESLAQYWLFKLLFVTLVACTGIVISAVLEECVIARLARESSGNLSFFRPVLRANYITLGSILLVAALKILPERFDSPDFLTAWAHSISTLLGLS